MSPKVSSLSLPFYITFNGLDHGLGLHNQRTAKLDVLFLAQFWTEHHEIRDGVWVIQSYHFDISLEGEI